MKKIITLLVVTLFVTTISAQAPQKMSYQAVIRNASNALVANANIRMRISVLQGTSTGTAVYVETQTATTNLNGLATVEIGAGTVVSGTFASIAWGTNAYYIKTETDPTGGTNYTIVGTSQFLSVPYALFASNSGSSTSQWTTVGDNIHNNNIGNVGIGTGAAVPVSPLTVRSNDDGILQEDLSGTSQIGFYTDAASAWLQTYSNTDLTFATNNNPTAQMTLQKGTGNFGIGTTTPSEKLQVAGKIRTVNLQVTNGSGVGKVLTSDLAGNATWQTPLTNQSYETTAANLSTTIQGAFVDFSETDVTAPTTGTYLITYYLDAYNTFSSTCNNACSSQPLVYYTSAYVYNKTTNSNYQTQHIDFSLQDHNTVAATSIVTTTLPDHQISGSIVKSLNANDEVGFRMRSSADPGVGGEIRIRSSNVTLVRLF